MARAYDNGYMKNLHAMTDALSGLQQQDILDLLNVGAFGNVFGVGQITDTGMVRVQPGPAKRVAGQEQANREAMSTLPGTQGSA